MNKPAVFYIMDSHPLGAKSLFKATMAHCSAPYGVQSLNELKSSRSRINWKAPYTAIEIYILV